MLRHPIGLVVMLGCGPRAGADPATPDGRVPVASVVATVPGASTEPEWPYPEPELDCDELIRGQPVTTWVSGAPVGAEVTIVITEAGMGAGPCVDGTSVCYELLDPETYAAGTADETGAFALTRDVAADEPPTVVYLQAYVYDPAIGVGTVTPAVQRHVMLNAEEAATSLVQASGQAGLGGLFTSGNSHTGGAAWVDYNGDLLPDLAVSNGAWSDRFLFLNLGDGTFADRSSLVRKPDPAIEDAAVLFADLENDGDADLLFVVDNALPVNSDATLPPEGGPNQLYVNRLDTHGDFVESAAAWGVLDPDAHRNICGGFADYDRDGFVDLHLGEWALNTLPDGTLDNFDRTLRNDGAGAFVDATAATTTDGYGRDVLACMWFDADLDGWPDLYLGHVNEITGEQASNPEADDVLYRNLGDGTFTDATGDSPGVGDDAWAAMGMDVGDIDNDGDWDLYVTDRWDSTDPYPRGNPLYVNQGDGTFGDNVCDVHGVCTGYPGWPTNFVDLNRDGWIDLWVGTGKYWWPDLMYINDGDGTFTAHHVPDFVGNASHGGASADYDADGDVDLFIWNDSANSRLFRNDARDANGWLALQLEGTASDRFAIGATVRLTAGGLTQMRRVSGGDSAHSQSERAVHFGVGTATSVDLDITWPSGAVQHLEDLAVGAFYVVDEDDGVRAEALEGTATWTAATAELVIDVGSSYRGRTHLDADGFGALAYDADAVRHAGTFVVTPAPGTVRVVSERGTAIELPVSVAP